jgi:GT2 family glycosyltransferase
MKKPAFVVAILLNWHNSADTLACLAQLHQSSYSNLAITVVDNGSTDDSVERIRGAYPHIPCIVSPINRGFAGGVNQAIQYAAAINADYILLLNSDLELPLDLISRLVAHAETDPRAGLRGPKVYRPGPIPMYSMYGFRVNQWGIQPQGYHLYDDGRLDGAPIDAISGCAMLISRRTWQSIGLLDERFFFYYEDIDYCMRVAAANLTIAVVPDSIVRHEPGGSTRTRTEWRQYLLARGRIRLFHKHRARFVLPLLILAELRETFNQLWGAMQSRNLPAVRGYVVGLFTALCRTQQGGV